MICVVLILSAAINFTESFNQEKALAGDGASSLGDF